MYLFTLDKSSRLVDYDQERGCIYGKIDKLAEYNHIKKDRKVRMSEIIHIRCFSYLATCVEQVRPKELDSFRE